MVRQAGRAYVKSLHYFYFIDEELGLCYLRVPTWCPFRLHFYCNGHNWLANQLQQESIGFELCDNAFLKIADFDQANLLAAQLDIEQLHTKLDHLAQTLLPGDDRPGPGVQLEHHAGLCYRTLSGTRPILGFRRKSPSRGRLR